MTSSGLIFLILLPAGLVAGGSTCARRCGVPPEENIEWMADGITWRNSLLQWKFLVEDECESIEVENWNKLFQCLDISGISCVNESARRYETDLLNCTFVYCEDGQYKDQKVLRALWKQLSQSYKEIMEAYKYALKYCPRKGCDDAATPTEESSTTTEGDQTASTTDDSNLASTTSSPDDFPTTTPLPENTSCNSTTFEFSKFEHLEYVHYKGTLPEMHAFSMCFWITPYQGITPVGTLLSYCVTGASGCNTMYVNFKPSEIDVFISGSTVSFDLSLGLTARSLLCFVLSNETNTMRFHLNATEVTKQVGASSPVVPQGGVLILGQDQDGFISGDTPGPPNDKRDGFRGIVDGFALWDRNVTAADINDMYQSGCTCANDAIVAFNHTNSVLTWNVVVSWGHACPDTGF